MSIPTNLKYTKDHEWAQVDGKVAVIGITDHAQSALGDVVFLELPSVGKEYKKGDTFGVVESVKAVSDLYAPLTGKVIEVNQALTNEPSVINKDPYQEGWLIRMEVSDPSSLEELMDAPTYEKYVKSLA